MSRTSPSPPEAADSAPPEAPDSETSADAALRAELETALQEAADAKDVARRAQADLVNVRRRAEEERGRYRSLAIEEVCRRLLPILDDLGRAAGEARRVESGEGVRLVLQRFEETLARQGLVEIRAQGQPFDPRLHQALQRVPAGPQQQDGDVAEVYLRGYLLDGRVVRPAQVIVAEAVATPTPSPRENDPEPVPDEAPSA